MSLEELRQLPNDLIVLGSHTRRHPRLTAVSDDEARDEIIALTSKTQWNCWDVTAICSRFHLEHSTRRLIDICREGGYQRVFTTLPYPAKLGPSEFVSGRVTAEPTDWPIEFFLKLRGSYSWLPVAFAAKRNLKALFSKPESTRQVRSDQLRSA